MKLNIGVNSRFPAGMILLPNSPYSLYLTKLFFLYLITIELKAFKKINKSVAVFINAMPTLQHKNMEFMKMYVYVCVCVKYDHLDVIVSVLLFFYHSFFFRLHIL